MKGEETIASLIRGRSNNHKACKTKFEGTKCDLCGIGIGISKQTITNQGREQTFTFKHTYQKIYQFINHGRILHIDKDCYEFLQRVSNPQELINKWRSQKMLPRKYTTTSR